MATPPAILYVDDDAPNLQTFRRNFDDDFRVLLADDGAAALQLLEEERVGVLVSDQRMPGMSGVELLARAAQRWPLVRRILLTAYSDRDLLLDAIQRGHVHDYVLKPWVGDDLRLRLEQQLGAYHAREGEARARRENEALRREVVERSGHAQMIGVDGGLSGIDEILRRVAPTDSTIMIRGESGTGKELVACEVHRRSARADGPFVRVNCSAFSEGVLESELFGHEAGAFTGARGSRAGRFEQADGGTLFLDEVGDLPPAVQVKLLRVVQERELERVGGNRTISVDLRLVAATHRDLDQMVATGKFRSDLYFRLNVVPLHLPPLRQRREDIEPLAAHFLAQLGREMGKQLTLGAAAIERLRAYDWPGNVRELRNVIERAAALADTDGPLEPGDLFFDFAAAPAAATVSETVARQEEAELRRVLLEARGSKTRAARALGIPRTTLHDRLRKYGIE